MKKNFICILLTIALLLFCTLTTFAQTVKITPNYASQKAQERGTSTIYILGDVNGDEHVDISDIVAIINLIAQNDKSNQRADVNNDGEIDVSDIVKVINIIANGGEEEESIRLSDLTKMVLNGTDLTVVNGSQVKDFSIIGGLGLSLSEPGTNADMKYLDIYSGGKVVTSIAFTGTDKIEIGDEGFVNFWMGDSIVHQTTKANIDSILVYDQLQEPLVYLGVTGFNQALYEKPIGVLDKNTVADYKSFISSLTTKYGTILYYAADNALDRITEYQFKTPLRSVNLITFTDGLDQGSHALCDTYITDKNYLSHLKSRITSTRVNGLPLTAYSVGLCGSDVTDLAQFQSNIRSLASSASNAFEETSMNDVKTRLDNIAQDIIYRINIQKLTFTIPVPGNGTKVRIVLDGEAVGNSNAYIEGTYQTSDKSLHNVTMKGITSDGATSIGTLTGKANGIFVTYTVADIIADFIISVGNIQQYSMTSTSSTWQKNSEFDSGSVVTEIHHNGSVVFVLLDCSSSMSSDFYYMKSYANSFISQIANNTNSVQKRPFGLLKPEKSLKISTDFIDFGMVLAGFSKSESFTVTNVGSFSKSFKVSVPGGVFNISDNGETFTLGPGDSKTFNVVFSSDDCDQYTSEITIKSTDGIETYIIKLTSFTESYCPDSHHPHVIDMGSAGKWACCNVGASAPWEYGGYYAWGETEEKDYYDWNTYTHCDGSYSTCHDLGSDIAGTEYDVAHVKWGGKWRMPSLDQIKLLNNCSSEWTELNGVGGRIFTASNGNSIFLPAAGGRWDAYTDDVGSYGFYWSSTQDPDDSLNAYYLDFSSGYAYWSNSNRNGGLSVRPVTE